MVPLKIQLPEDFLQEETRCGYTIYQKMKEVWAVQLDLLAELDLVCKKYDIKYFASGGTALGAVRHKGFIPWDDDVDIMMFRLEYDKLCQIAEHEFKHPYFFQTEWTDKGSLRGHAQLRNSMTTGILATEYEKRYSFNQGIFIDIFPLDAVPDDKTEFQKAVKIAEKLKKKFHRLAGLSERYYIPKSKNVKFYVKKMLHSIASVGHSKMWNYDRYYKEYEILCSKWNDQNTKMIGILGMRFSDVNLRFRADFEETIDVPFEFMTIPIPKNYDHALHHIFGDYMKFVRGGSLHGGMILDTDIPYTEYLKENNKLVFHSELYYHD